MRGRFQPIKTLSSRLFRKNKGRNVVAVLAILMTTLMFTTLFTLAQSMSKNMVEMTFRQTGYDAQASFKSITGEEAALIGAHPDVREVGESIVLGVAENRELKGHQTEIRWGDDSYAAHSFAWPAAGRMPEAADELAVDTTVLDYLGIPHELGQQVTLEWRTDLNSQETTASTFTLCGYWEGNASSYASMAWVSRAFADQMTGGADGPVSEGQILGTHMAQVSLYSDRNIEETLDGILADTDLTGLEYGVNLAYSPEMGAAAFSESLPMYLGMILVFVAGYLIIYNIFQISVTADVQFYGKLKTLGMTKKQLRRLIYGQANRLCLIGIPIGLVLGWGLGFLLVPTLLGMLEGESVVSVSPVIFLGSALFAWVTVLISCLRPARLAGKVSPVEALRACDAPDKTKRTAKKRGSASLREMAWANLGRNKKRTALVVCSLSLGLVLLSCFYAKNAAFDMEKYLSGLTIADFELSDASSEDYTGGYDPQGATLNQELVSQVEQADGVEETGHAWSHQFIWQMDDGTAANLAAYYNEDILADWASYDAQGAQDAENSIKEKQATVTLFGLDGIPLDAMTDEDHILAGSFDPEAFATGEYVLAVSTASISKEEAKGGKTLPASSVGQTVELEGRTYQVMAVVLPDSSVVDGALEAGENPGLELEYVIPSDSFRELYPDNTMRRLYVNVEEGQVDAMQELLDGYTASVDRTLPVTSRQTMAQQYEEETRSSAVMGNAISVIIALVGVLNFANSMITAIVSRKREFAVIQSVGMTKRQLRRMLVYEGLYYAGLTLLTSWIVSALAVGIGVRAVTAADDFSTFRFTLLPLGVCTPLILILAVLIPCLCFLNLEKQSVVERLRME